MLTGALGTSGLVGATRNRRSIDSLAISGKSKTQGIGNYVLRTSPALVVENGVEIKSADTYGNYLTFKGGAYAGGDIPAMRFKSSGIVLGDSGNGSHISGSGQNSDYGNMYFGYNSAIGSSVIAGFTVRGWCFLGPTIPVYIGSTSAVGPNGVSLYAPSNYVLEQRFGTNAQTFRLYNTYTSSTSYENLQFKANAGAAYQIGSAIGSAGGTNRDLNFGSWDTAATFASSFYVGSTYAGINDSKIFYVGTSSRIEFSALSSLGSPAIRFAYGGGSPANIYGGSNTLGVGINGFTRLLFSVSSTDFTGSPFTISNTAVATGAYTGFTFTGAAHTNQTASTEATMVNWNLAQTVQFATGAITTQRAMRIQAPTYGFVGASTITTASTLSISGPPVAGTNATITNKYALAIENNGILALQNVSGYETGTPRIAIRLGSPYVGLGLNSFRVDGDGYCYSYAGFEANYLSPIGFQGMKFTFDGGWGNISRSSGSLNGNGNHFSSAYNIGLIPAATYGVQVINGINAMKLQVYNTYTSSTSYETLNIKGKASANFEIGPENGSAGGTLRGLTLGGYTAGSATITPWLSFTSSGNASFSQYATIQGGVLVEAGGSYTTSYAAPAQVRVRRAQGTQASPTQATTGIQLGIIGAQGLNDAGAYAGYTSYISFNAGENITTTGCGGYFNFYTTPVGSLTEVMRTWIGAAGNFGIGVFAAEPSTLLTINGDMLRLTTAKTPATSSSTANQGEIGWDASSLYVASATNTWKRTPVIGFSTGTSCVPAFVVDRYYSGYASQNLSTQAMTANILTFIPINIPYTFSATRIGINVTTAVAGGARLGIYNDIGGVPSGTPLLDAGTVDIGTTGEKEITITQSLVTGLYWLAVVTNSAATFTAENLGTDGVSVPNLGSATGAGNSITHLTQSHTYAALPTVGTLTAATTKTPPRVWLRNVVASASPTFVASSVSGSYPVGIAAGDIIVLYISDHSSPTLPAGFTNLGTQTASMYDRACYKVASGSETGVIVSVFAVQCLVIRGGSTANIAFSFSATHTVAAANSLVAVLGWSDGDDGPGIDVTAPAGWTRRTNTTPAHPGSVVLTLDALRAAGSYTHTVSFSGSYSSGQISFSIG